MKWFKKHWNDPITVGGYTKMCIWSFAISVVVCALEFTWMFTDIKYKIEEVFEILVNKFKRV